MTVSLSDHAAAITHWRTDPVGCAIDVLGVEPKAWQRVALRAIADPATDRLAIRACHGPGKTWLDAVILLWFMLCFYPARVPCTAPTKHQLSAVLWPEIKQLMMQSKYGAFGIDLEKIFEWTAEKVTLREAPQLHFAIGRTATVRQTVSGPEAYGLQGFHKDNLLFIIDEASGVHRAVYDVSEGARSTGQVVKTLASGNPNTPAGWFFELFHGSPLWKTMRINYKNGDLGERGIEWAQQMIAEYGIDSPFVRVRVLGLFPRGIEGALIGLDDWNECIGNYKKEEVLALHPGAKMVMGLDVAGSGNNETIASFARGNCLLKQETIHEHKQDRIAEEAIGKIDSNECEIVVVDSDGGYGAAVCDIMESHYSGKKWSPEIIRWHGNATARDADQFHNKRAEIGWAVKMATESGILSVPDISRLKAQATQLKYQHKNLKGKNAIILEKKEDFKKRMERLGASDSRSPDEYDSATYALAPSLLGYPSLPCVTLPGERDRFANLIQ